MCDNDRLREFVRMRNEFVRRRNEAFFSFDKEKILSYCDDYGISLPSHSSDVFWGAVAKAVLNIVDAPEEAKEKARNILDRLGWSYTIDS